MYRPEVDEPGGCRPRLFGIPTPILAPRLLCPQCPRQHTYGKERKASAEQIFDGCHYLIVALNKVVERHKCCNTEQRIREHIYRHVGHKPRTLQCWHKTLVVEFGTKTVDDHKDGGE